MQSAAEQAPTHQGAPAGGLTSHPGPLRPTEIPEKDPKKKDVSRRFLSGLPSLDLFLIVAAPDVQ